MTLTMLATLTLTILMSDDNAHVQRKLVKQSDTQEAEARLIP